MAAGPQRVGNFVEVIHALHRNGRSIGIQGNLLIAEEGGAVVWVTSQKLSMPLSGGGRLSPSDPFGLSTSQGLSMRRDSASRGRCGRPHNRAGRGPGTEYPITEPTRAGRPHNRADATRARWHPADPHNRASSGLDHSQSSLDSRRVMQAARRSCGGRNEGCHRARGAADRAGSDGAGRIVRGAQCPGLGRIVRGLTHRPRDAEARRNAPADAARRAA